MMDELEGKVCRCFTRAIRRGSRALSRLYGCFKQQTANGGTGSADVIVENSDGLVCVAPNGCGDHRVFVIGNEILMRQVCKSSVSIEVVVKAFAEAQEPWRRAAADEAEMKRTMMGLPLLPQP